MLPAQKDSKFKNTVWACRIFFYFHSMIFQAVYLLLCLFIPATMQTSQILPQKVVILGAGIHGTSIAYHLSQKGIQSLIVEKSGIASAASGKAGGFLARNWGHGVTKQLHEKSFDMHIDIANTLGIESFRKINTLQVDGSRKGTNIASWLDRKVSSTMMDSETAQVTPKELTQKLMQSALDSGSRLIMGTAEKVHIDENTKTVTGIDISGFGTIQTDHVVVCLGPWSGVYCEDWFNLHIPLDGVKSTSIVFNEVEALKDEPYACFCSEDANGCHLEMYPRVNEELYICGCGGSDYVNGDRLRKGGDCESAELIQADPLRVAAALRSVQSMSTLGDRTPTTTQACMRPCTDDAMPVMGAIPGVTGAWSSFGHNCWGILWAPVCGLAMAELIADGECKCLDLKPFSPARYVQRSDSLRGRKKGSVPIGEQW